MMRDVAKYAHYMCNNIHSKKIFPLIFVNIFSDNNTATTYPSYDQCIEESRHTLNNKWDSMASADKWPDFSNTYVFLFVFITPLTLASFLFWMRMTFLL